ncbi:TonB-dependent receptor [candidate division KSB1 bacterium]|nr:outer membrane beta-barrel protein [candidate division KSB1 bacterium]RQW04971.1 MAG: TonB-dependent receptor [candidate division KSB1 bacterium]
MLKVNKTLVANRAKKTFNRNSQRSCGFLFFPLFIALLLGFSVASFAQHTITGRVIDENSEPLTYAHVVLLAPVDSTLKYFDVADDQGIYEIKNIKSGDYLLQFSFVTKETIYEPITIPVKNQDLGDKILKTTSTEEVVVTAEYVPIAVKSDTLEFNAKAFKTKPDAVVEDLLKKIPGVEVDKSGNVKAMGEDVEQVLVDGKEFFGKDTKVAIKNLSAKAVDKVQIYDKKSEEAQFTGIDDGVRQRTIDFLLNEDHKKGYFGRLEAGGGAGDETHYKVGGKVYRFSTRLQSAFLGNVNNINDFGYAREDQKEWGRQVEGLNTTGAGGLNLSYNVDKYNRYFASYLGSYTTTDVERTFTSTNFLQRGDYTQDEHQQQDARSMPHKINFGVRHKFNRNHNLTVDGNVHAISDESELYRFTTTTMADSLVNTLDQFNETDNELASADVKAVYIAKIRDDKTQVQTTFGGNYSRNKSVLVWRDEITTKADSAGIFYQSQENMTDHNRLSITPTLIQKLSPLWILNTSLNLSSFGNTLSRDQEIIEGHRDPFMPLYPDFSTAEQVISPSVSLRRNSNKHQFNFSLGGRWNQFDKDVGDSFIVDEHYFYLLPGFSYENFHKKGRRISFRYNTSIGMPSAQQLYPVTNTANALSLYTGNLDLTPEERHNAHFSYWMFDYFSFTSLYASMNAGYTKNKISTSQFTNEELIKITTPVNTPYHYFASGYVSFSTPIRAFGLKINTWLHENWNKGITRIDGRENVQTNLTHTLDLNIENRKKEIWDVRLGGRVSLTDATFSIASDDARYVNTSTYTDIRYTPTDKWNFEIEASVVNYDDNSFAEVVDIPVLNARIDYYVKGEKMSIALWANDLLNQNIGFRRFSAANYLMQQEWTTIGRYVMMSVNWRIGS